MKPAQRIDVFITFVAIFSVVKSSDLLITLYYSIQQTLLVELQ